MAAERVTSDEVKIIIDTDLADISPFISAAHLIVNKQLIGKSLGEDILTEIERWLSAHFIAIRDPKVKSEKIGEASAAYESPIMGQGLQGTSFGQQVLLLDVSGTLIQLGKKKVSFKVDDFRDA